MKTIQNYRIDLERQKGKREQVLDDISVSNKKIKSLNKEIEISKKAQLIITAVAKNTQEELQYRITEPVSLALASVYDNPYTMISDFKIAGRGTTECYLKFERNGNKTKPLDASGGGPINVAAFALQVGALTLEQPGSRKVLILDEPGRFVSRDKMALFGQMISETSKQLDIQIIMVSHINELISEGDKVLDISIKNGVSSVSSVSNINKIKNQ